MKIVNRIVDTLYSIFEYIVLLIFIVSAIVVIGWRFNIMYEQSLVKVDNNEVTQTSQSTENKAKNDTIVKIVIPKGTKANNIVNLLKEYNLDFDSDQLLKKLESIKEEELPSGEFELSLGSSTTEIEKVLGLN